MRYLIENLRRWLQRQEETKGSAYTVAFFFCNSNDWLRNSQTQLLSSLLYQILSQNKQLFRYLNDSDLKDYVLRIKDDPGDCSDEGLEILWKSLSTILQRSNDLIFWIFIDAIDELTLESRKIFLRQMGQAVDQDLSQKVKLVFSDRVHPNSRGLKHTSISFEMQSRTEIADDVRRFITTQVEDLCTNGTIPWRYQTQIEETFLELSEGNFLQASLAWANFSSGVSYWSPQVINNRLESVRKISKEATAYYCSLLERIPEDSQEVAKVGFTWVLGSRKPLNVSELQHAVAISAGQSSWADLVESLGFNFEVQFDTAFGYLLRVEPDRNVRFAHSTVKELLTSPPANLSPKNAAVLSKFRIQKSDIDAELAKRCIIILSFRDFARLRDIAQETLSDRIKDFLISSLQSEEGLIGFDFSKYDDNEEDEDPPKYSELDTKFRELKRSLSRTNLGTDNHTLLSYCVSYWNYHCGQGGSDPEVVESLSRFVLLRQSHFFHLVAMLLGMARIHRGYLWKDINQFERLPPLHFVMRVGDHPSVVQSLIDQGQRVNRMDCHGWTALGWAILENRKDALEVLLSQDSTRLDKLDPEAEGPLHLACRSGAGPDIIQRLLDDPRTKVNARSLEGWTVLHWCLPRENLQTIVYSLLKRKDLDINTPDGNGTTYLDQVFHDGLSEDIALKVISRWDVPSNWFERIPKRNYKVMNQDRPPMSYLHMASFLQWYEIEDLILSLSPSKAVDVEMDGMNLLERYAFHGVEHRLLRVLAELPPNIFEGHKEQSTKLMHLCAQQDWELTVQELRTKFNIEDEGLETDEYGRTLAHWASELHWKSVDSLIREKPSSWVNHAANDGKTALHIAVEHRNQLACESLLKAGANYLAKDKSNKLPIHIAAEQGHRSIVFLLLECPIRDYGKDLQGRDLLHFLVMWHSDVFIRMCLVILRPKIDVLDKRRRSPLHYAAIFGNSAAVKVLLEIGANANLKDNLGSTPVHYALLSGSLKSFQLMRDSGANLDIMDRFHRNTLHLAIRSENSELIEHILKIIKSEPKTAQRHVRHVDTFGQTVLHRVCLWDTLKYRSLEVSEDDEDFLDPGPDDYGAYSDSKPIFTKIGKQIRALRTLGAKVNARDNQGFTPLHTASKFSNAIATEVLLVFPETEPSAKDNKDRTPLDFAVVDGQDRIANALRGRRAVHSAKWQTKVRPLYVPWQEDWGSSMGWTMVVGDTFTQYYSTDVS
jgi:ankyrin repeat protein